MTCLCPCQAASEQSGSTSFQFPATGVRVSPQAILLGIDDVSWPLQRSVCLYLSKPEVRKDPVLIPSRDNPDAPDYMATHFYGTVLFDQGKFRMWYYAVHPKPGLKDLIEGPICYAESPDGLRWTKPSLGQVMFNGSRENNIIALPGDRFEGVEILKDEDDPNPLRRYKMVYNPSDPKFSWTLRTATSADGIRWAAGAELPIRSFLEFCSLYKHNGLYVVNSQIFGRGEGGRPQGRQAYAWVSTDFDHWLQEPALSFTLPEPVEAPGFDSKYDQVHLGVGGASFGNVVVGLYGLWHQRGWGVGGTTCDFGLVLSHDGMHFREPVKGHVFLSHKDSAVTPVSGKNYPTVLAQSNGILNVGDETRIYHGRWRNANYPGDDALDYWGEVALATLPRDRWGALGLYPDTSEGSVWSATIQLPSRSCEVWLNADAANGIRVEIADEQFNLLPNYSGPNSGAAAKDSGLDCQVRWSKGDLGSLSGKAIRLRLHLKKQDASTPRLYAAYFRIK